MKRYAIIFLGGLISSVIFMLFIHWVVWLAGSTPNVSGFVVTGFTSFFIFSIFLGAMIDRHGKS